MSQSTNKAIIREFRISDGLRIDLRDIERKDHGNASRYELCKIWAASQVSGTMTVDDEVIACAGVLIDRFGQASAWILTSDKVEQYMYTFYKSVKRLMDVPFKKFGAIRMQTYVLCENKQSAKFVERLGFTKEGKLCKCMHNGLDRYIYARFE